MIMEKDKDKLIATLTLQLQEKDQAIEGLQEINQSLGQACNNDAKEIERLREKENLLNLIVDGYYTPTNIVERQIREQNQTAIAELKKVLKMMEEKQFYKKEDTAYCVHPAQIAEYVLKQIKSLKGDK